MLASDSATASSQLSGMALSDTEGSDEEDDSDTSIHESANGDTDLDEAVTGYLQTGAAGTQLVNSQAEAHMQVTQKTHTTVAAVSCL